MEMGSSAGGLGSGATLENELRWIRDSVRRVPREAKRPATVQATSEMGDLGDQIALSLFVLAHFLAHLPDLT